MQMAIFITEKTAVRIIFSNHDDMGIVRTFKLVKARDRSLHTLIQFSEFFFFKNLMIMSPTVLPQLATAQPLFFQGVTTTLWLLFINWAMC